MKVVDKEDLDTQEPTFSNIPVEVSIQIGITEPKAEIIPDFIQEVYAVTPKPSRGIELIEMEPQQQDNDEVDQDVVTQEPTSP